MAFSGNYVSDTFKQELLAGQQNFSSSGGNTFWMALYTSSATLTNTNAAYTSTNETSGTGYTARGKALTIPASMPSRTTTVGWTDFDDVTWTTASITARGAMIYNATGTPTDRSVVILDFLADKTSTAGDFTVQFPAANSTSAIIRIG
jgi:hypothetical protein